MIAAPDSESDSDDMPVLRHALSRSRGLHTHVCWTPKRTTDPHLRLLELEEHGSPTPVQTWSSRGDPTIRCFVCCVCLLRLSVVFEIKPVQSKTHLKHNHKIPDHTSGCSGPQQRGHRQRMSLPIPGRSVCETGVRERGDDHFM